MNALQRNIDILSRLCFGSAILSSWQSKKKSFYSDYLIRITIFIFESKISLITVKFPISCLPIVMFWSWAQYVLTMVSSYREVSLRNGLLAVAGNVTNPGTPVHPGVIIGKTQGYNLKHCYLCQGHIVFGIVCCVFSQNLWDFKKKHGLYSQVLQLVNTGICFALSFVLVGDLQGAKIEDFWWIFTLNSNNL